MSGHSHARTVKHKKEASAAQRSKAFSKVSREIMVAVKEGGNDPAINSKLRSAIEAARSFNMPTENIERAISKAAGGGEAGDLQEILLEAYGPGGIALLIKGITDNKNRMLGEVKQMLAQHQGKMVEGGAVRWMFDQKGAITLDPKGANKEELELKAIEAGAQDLYWREDGWLDIFTLPQELEQVKAKLEAQGLALEAASLDWVPKEHVETSQETKTAAEKLFSALDEHDDVQDIYSNISA
ncbi:MAG: transcriptional regulator [Candidatus Wildermuthbacteria bacterium RIFCSPLOWO2_01_FULL_47_18]|uniref:Probable transcriptional regulatory protein A3A27_02900 n=2 Tax=Candidatus Wildermuthiibacteriota TaxID=1817923 RepID=A0A1G2RGK0_9BACT|nr:MAG: transcriptional regulator [Candidatus Wildermuthbacteria bacterium RIFCSPHIGHO2_02_FULL_48_16]OHA71960.1 MAG: transcriptional regulator [Candidatus Wildermuthbacteria bacterium RIFCSPLOWO2_01_FULL_47_18]